MQYSFFHKSKFIFEICLFKFRKMSFQAHLFTVDKQMPYFVVWILWPELRIYSQGVWFFDKFENITRELR